MNEIKYHAWDGKNMFGVRKIDMVYYGSGKQTGLCELYYLSGELKGSVVNISFNDLIFLQYTGQKDTKKKEIFEGHIIECEYYHGFKTTIGIDLLWRGVVEYSKYNTEFFVIKKTNVKNNSYGGCYAVGYSGEAIKRYEIIGNIYENSDLLSEKIA